MAHQMLVRIGPIPERLALLGSNVMSRGQLGYRHTSQLHLPRNVTIATRFSTIEPLTTMYIHCWGQRSCRGQPGSISRSICLGMAYGL